MRRQRAAVAFLLVFLLTLSGCSGSGDSVTEPPEDDEPTISAVRIDPDSAEVEQEGADQQFSATAVDETGGVMQGVAFSWRSTDDSVATVSSNGLATAHADGLASIIATADGEADTATFVANLIRDIFSVEVSPSEVSVEEGDSTDLAVEVDAESGANTTVRWSSKDTSVASVDSTGKVTGRSSGSTAVSAISVADSSKRDSSSVTVTEPPPEIHGVTVTPDPVSIDTGETRRLMAEVDADSGADTRVTWTTGNPSVATVDGDGNVTGQGAGKVTITATSVADTTKKGTSEVTVQAPQPQVLDVTITPGKVSIDVCETITFAANVQAEDGADTSVSWSSTNTTVATVDQNGNATGEDVGNAQIVAASVQDPSVRDSAELEVTEPEINSVSVSPSSATIEEGETITLSATVDAEPCANTDVTWSSSNASVASVDENGNVTGQSTGTATIIATSVVDSSKSGAAEITVLTAGG